MDGTTLTQQALQLTIVEKVHLIDALWQSLDSFEREEIDLAWLRESQNRLIAYKAGRIAAIDGQKILSEIEASL
jgi:putative addiction module component (TIGR02574 family)